MNRTVTRQVTGRPAVDGAGVSLVRVLGPDTAADFDPILMLDSFDSADPAQYAAGFPMHPHRGIETVTYVARGRIQHRDNLGFEDTIVDGEVQWMCAGSGILHEERLPASERLLGAQLWLNLPAADKMCEPRYHAVKADQIPEVAVPGGTVRVLAGSYGGARGHEGDHLPLDYYDIRLEAGASLTVPVDPSRSAFLFTLEGTVEVGGVRVAEKTAAKLSEGDGVKIRAVGPAEVLFVASEPLREPVAWGGPVVMNTEAELDRAWDELRRGTFVK